MSNVLISRYDAVLDVLDRIASWVVITTMGVMTAILLLQVFYRYVMNDSLVWGWDVPRVCFIWAVLFSIPLGMRYNAHVGIDLLVERFSDSAKRIVLSINSVLIIIISLTIAWYASVMADATWDQLMPGIPLSVGVFYVSLAVSQIHICLHVGRNLLVGEVRDEHWGEA